MKSVEIIERELAKVGSKSFKGNQWGPRHVEAHVRGKGIERAISGLLNAAALYADEYAKELGSSIGEDHVLGPDWAKILSGFRGLLNGPLGRLDGGTLDKLVGAIAQNETLDPDNLD